MYTEAPQECIEVAFIRWAKQFGLIPPSGLSQAAWAAAPRGRAWQSVSGIGASLLRVLHPYSRRSAWPRPKPCLLRTERLIGMVLHTKELILVYLSSALERG